MEIKTELEVRLTKKDIADAVREFATRKSDWEFSGASVEWQVENGTLAGCVIRFMSVKSDKFGLIPRDTDSGESDY